MIELASHTRHRKHKKGEGLSYESGLHKKDFESVYYSRMTVRCTLRSCKKHRLAAVPLLASTWSSNTGSFLFKVISLKLANEWMHVDFTTSDSRHERPIRKMLSGSLFVYYADAHRNKTGQRYAAATAAAYAKELLPIIPRGWQTMGHLMRQSPASPQTNCSVPIHSPKKPHFLVPLDRNTNFIGRNDILSQLLKRPFPIEQ